MSYASRAAASAHLPQVTTTTENVSAPQRREFVTAASALLPARPRSTSVSTANGTRQVTTTIHPPSATHPSGRTIVQHGPVTRGDDTNRSHTHPGGGPHVPGPGLVPGTTSTPAQRALLTASGTSTTLGAWSKT